MGADARSDAGAGPSAGSGPRTRRRRTGRRAPRLGDLPPGPRRKWIETRTWLLPLAILLCVALPHLDQGAWRTDTARYAAIGLQAWENGRLLDLELAPGEHYFSKPPLGILIHGGALRIFGTGSAVARLPTVAAAALCVLATVSLVRAFHGRDLALGAGLALALSYEFFRRVREISLDMWQLAFMLAAAALLVRAIHRNTAWRALLAGGLVGLALLTKPFVALLAPLLVGAWAIATRRAGRLPLIGLSLLAAILVASPWHALMIARHGDAFTDVYVFGEVVERAAGEIAAEPWWYYLAMLARTGWPWVAFAVVGAALLVRSGRLGRSAEGPAFALLWAVAWLVVLSLFPDKRPRYLLPVLPAIAWLAAGALAAPPLRSGRRHLRAALEPAVGLGVLAATAVAVLPVRVHAPVDPSWTAVFETLRTSEYDALRTVGLDSNQRARFAINGFRWPVPWDGSAPDLPGADVAVVRAAGSEPTDRERVLLRTDRLVLTLIDAPGRDTPGNAVQQSDGDVDP